MTKKEMEVKNRGTVFNGHYRSLRMKISVAGKGVIKARSWYMFTKTLAVMCIRQYSFQGVSISPLSSISNSLLLSINTWATLHFKIT